MANTVYTVYQNFYLSNEIEDQFTSHLDLQQFCQIDNSLQGEAGMVRKINVYSATDGTQKLKVGAGNTKSIEVSFTPEEYVILLAQNRFKYYDEQAMADPMLVPTGTRHMATDMFNTVNADIFAEYNKATLKLYTKAFNFDALVDGVAKLNIEDIEDATLFGFVAPVDVAALRKSLLSSLQYVEAFARTGYIGTVAGINLYTKKDAEAGEIVVATPEAVTLFNKVGTEIEQGRDANTRENAIYARKYYIAALTDATKAVKIIKGTEPVPFVAVTGIEDLPDAAVAGTPLTLSGTVAPATATNKTIVWSVKTAGDTGAVIADGVLTATDEGTATITATIVHGTDADTDYTKDIEITVTAGGGS